MTIQSTRRFFKFFQRITDKPFFFLHHTLLQTKTDFAHSDKMSLSTNDLYPIVVELKDNDHVNVENHSSSSIVDSYKEKATTAAVSFLSGTLFCGQENAPIDSNPKDYIISKDRMDVAAADRCVGEMGNHRKHDHHGSWPRLVTSYRNSSKRFNQKSQVTAKQIVFAEAASHPKYRQLDDEYVLTQQVGSVWLG